MPPLPAIAGVFRVTIDWSVSNGVTPRNVFHVRSPTATVAQIATGLESAFVAGIGQFETVSSLFQFNSVSILPLDGTSATTIHTLATTHTGGAGSGEFIPAMAGVLSLRTAQRGSRGRGRMYLGPSPEAIQTNGQLDNTRVGDSVAGWVAFENHLVAESPSIEMVVASYVHADAHSVTSISMRQIAGTIRHRQDQLVH